MKGIINWTGPEIPETVLLHFTYARDVRISRRSAKTKVIVTKMLACHIAPPIIFASRIVSLNLNEPLEIGNQPEYDIFVRIDANARSHLSDEG